MLQWAPLSRSAHAEVRRKFKFVEWADLSSHEEVEAASQLLGPSLSATDVMLRVIVCRRWPRRWIRSPSRSSKRRHRPLAAFVPRRSWCCGRLGRAQALMKVPSNSPTTAGHRDRCSSGGTAYRAEGPVARQGSFLVEKTPMIRCIHFALCALLLSTSAYAQRRHNDLSPMRIVIETEFDERCAAYCHAPSPGSIAYLRQCSR
jgi:hypothetical protein